MSYSPAKIAIIVWLVISIPYVLWSQYDFWNNKVFRYAKGLGAAEALAEVITKSQTCEPVSLKLKDREVFMLNVACLKLEENLNEGK